MELLSILVPVAFVLHVGVWWLASRIVFGRTAYEGLVVVCAGALFPVTMSDTVGFTRENWLGGVMLLAWELVAVAIALGWLCLQAVRWLQGKPEPRGLLPEPSGVRKTQVRVPIRRIPLQG